MSLPAEQPATKRQWRRKLLDDRATVSAAEHDRQALALTESVVSLVRARSATTVCAYVPVGSEPGSLGMLDGLLDAGCRVLLPVVTGASPLQWAAYDGRSSLREARYGLLEPTGEQQGTDAVRAASVVLVPALAVDRRGIRLGRGAGHYDRSLPMAAPDAELVAVVRDAELVDELPGEPHDVRMTSALTPERGVTRLPL